ncbi:MAG: periplasmic heavy metal sensor [Desulfobulbaceae bacterium]|nr:periplasmic heavy metal sensor [Desulfobulbaceae bacterium]
MKKLILVMAAIMAAGAFSYQIVDADPYRRGGGGYGYGCDGPGCGGAGPNPEDFAAREKFFEDTREIRGLLFEKRSQYAEVIRTEPADKSRARELWSEIYDLQKEIDKIAAEQGITLGGPGYCLGPDGDYEGDRQNRNSRGNCGSGPRGGCRSAS